ncbi:4878_t:CDS:2 [Funneliformis geosporum]|uniref:11523_t:CDS:1 n=1 Tax=Funneliformis geosporum TaxID=1117311 RepID=A0A9W4SK35_9GLOM|nr:4878_t:CDS:2 [Funneliformis geosporum]CAI2171994.1 11523_t:CDS:2 [Funneliformis geosporum]
MTPDLTSGSEEDPRIRRIVHELCNQLAYNREQTRQLQKQSSELKGRVEEYNGSLFRPNYRDIERQNAQLIYENHILNEENAELTAMVKDYEQSLKTIMMRFRYQAYEIQQSKLDMQRNYEILLEEQRSTTAQVLSENASLQTHLSNLGNLVREAHNAHSDLETDILLESLVIENQGLRQMLEIANGIGLPAPTTTSSKKTSVLEEKENGEIRSPEIYNNKLSELIKEEEENMKSMEKKLD